MMECRRALRWTALGPVLLTSLLAGPAHGEESPAVPRSAIKLLQKAGYELGRAGHGPDLEEIAESMVQLGMEHKEVAKALSRARRAVRPGRSPAAEVPKAAQFLRQAVAELDVLLHEGAEDEQRRRAQVLLGLDDQCEGAHRVLGHAKTEHGWSTAEAARVTARRVQIAEAVRKAYHIEVPVETSVSRHTILQGLYGRDGVRVSCPTTGTELHSVLLSEEKLTRILRQTLRALALSRYLRGEAFALPQSGVQETVLALGSRADYHRAVEDCFEHGGVTYAPMRTIKLVCSFADPRGHRTACASTEASLQEELFFQFFPDAYQQAALDAGHINWVCLRFLGLPFHGVAWVDPSERSTKETRTSTGIDRRTRKTLLRLSRCGLAGRRAYLRYLAARGEDPSFANCVDDGIGKIREERLLKATFVVEYLQETGEFARTWHETPPAMRLADADAIRGFEATVGGPMASFEKRWKEWLLPAAGGGLVQRLEASDPGEAVAPGAHEALTRLNEARRAAFGAVRDPVELDPDLSQGCRLHARYLVLHPEVHNVWPDVHEEYPDQEGFTVEGSSAGLNSVIHHGHSRPADAVDSWLSTYFHRLPLLTSGLLRIGWGFEGGIAVLDSSSMVRVPTFICKARWPAKGARDVPLRFSPEIPNPVPGEDQSTWGYPVSLQLFEHESVESQVTLRLYRGSVSPGNEVPCHFTSPSRPLNVELAPRGAFGLIPKAPLAPDTVYHVQVTGLPDNADWSFRTGPRE